MGFEEKDATAQVDVETKAMGVIVRRRDNSGGGAPVAIIVETTKNDVSVNVPVPQATVDAGWPGASKTFKAHMFAIIDAALA